MGSGRDDTVRRRGAVAAGLAVLAAVLVACTPPPAPVLPACPARATVYLEPTDPVSFSLPRAVAPDGTWVALSRVVGGDVVISARRADAGAPTQVLGSIPYTETATQQPRVSVAADGARVLWAGTRYASVPDDATSVLHRWTRATGAVEQVAPPVAADPPGGTPYPVNLRLLSADGERAIWTQAFYQGGFDFQFVRSITDTATDAVLAQQVIDEPPLATPSLGARTETATSVAPGGEYTVVDLDTFAATSLTPALAAAQVAFPGGGFQPATSSDDGRWTVLQRPFSSPPTYLRWDAATSGVSLIDQGPGIRIDSVDDTGTVVYSVDDGTTVRSVHQSADGTARVVADAPMLSTWHDEPVRPLTSADRRTTVFSEPVPLLGNRLIARRCS